MINWRIGCSGFHYKHWKGTFYPEDLAHRKWFNHYCQFFNTLELNVTFYRFPRLSFLENWRSKSPEGFRFAVKAPRAITHYKKFIGTTDLITDFYNTIREGLQDKLGCVLFQLPPNFHYSEDHLAKITSSLDNSFLNVVEFRHASWWTENVYEKLALKNISFCGMSHPTLPHDIISNTSLLYYRMHGEGQLYSSNYENHQLQNFVTEIKTKKNIKDAYIFFNNDIHTYAVYNALEMLKMTE
ncbi:DUF72 domain-containing protein [Pedobacter sp. P351]|uniref:DUF72 domain-containing protein n=1 Tax=Pedobacter superstes TaxID=3133441 RepID=UPI0030B3F006